MPDVKKCSKCHANKLMATEFYMYKGNSRGECKSCTIKGNIKYQKKIQSWKHRFVNEDSQRSYMAEYYHNNKDKFAEYRRKFKERNPEYHREYARTYVRKK